jgi:DNA processing protein
LNTKLLQQQLAMLFLQGIGPARARLLLSKTPCLQALFEWSLRDLEKATGLTEKVLVGIKREEALEEAKSHIDFIKKKELRTLFISDADYPRRLKQCADAPLMLFVKGAVDFNSGHWLSIVGTRQASRYGKEVVEKLLASLKGLDITVVSGLALGIDVHAHQECLKNGIKTVGVLGHGLDRIYPSQHREIAQEMTVSGALLTEFPHNTNPDRQNFPRRNRIVAGMCDATIVIESRVKGGSLITADLANDYARDVFAVPGPIYQENSKGCNRLIADAKAHLYHSPEQFLKMMDWVMSSKKEPAQRKLWTNLGENEQKVLTFLSTEGDQHMDALSYKCELPISETSVLLFHLEMNGLVRALPGKRYACIA